MLKSAQVVLTGYNKSEIDKSVKEIHKYLKTINVQTTQDTTPIKAKSKLWGCEKNNIEEEILSIRGSENDLRKILNARISDGIYLQLLVK